MNELISLALFEINESISRRIGYKTFDIINIMAHFDGYNYVVSNIWIKYKIERKVGTVILFVWSSMETTEIGCL